MSTPYSGAPTTQAPPTPIYVGLDLSLTSTGVATIHGDIVTVRRVASKATQGNTSDTAARLDRVVAEILGSIPLTEHTHVAIEGPSYGSVGFGQHVRAGLWWLVRTELARAGVDTIIAAPSTVKKYATGKGNAGKDAVLAAVVKRYSNVDVTGNDEADALVLAAICARRAGAPIEDSLPAVQAEAVAAVTR
ncbi:crossover junction endodeoxyribonuclease RuvC [Microbacterium hominis]|uniref:Uncharacterized protein n=1 Tax=Microbacterium hominis TaxID=162426 RepID=A0A2K9D534_9MICO|nr:crossover junction endodeoxyribonuclease RuvC [Microbacterium hominis]AUG28780.1 hypothetical protein CXR34_04355 [Microbacterium hominis]